MIGELLMLIGLFFVFTVALKPCLWKIRRHKWVEGSRVDYCSTCGLIRRKVRK